MFDVALDNAGAKIVLASSCDEKYPPENIIDGNSETFWTSTGIFPQEFIISFASLMNLNSIKLLGCNVRKMQVERSVKPEPVDFEALSEKVLENTDGSLQNEDLPIQTPVTANHLRFVISSGYDHFVAVHRVHVDGNAVHG